jgi:hypothetical protein
MAAKDLLEFPYLLLAPYALTEKHLDSNLEGIPENERNELHLDTVVRCLHIGQRRFVNRKESIRLMHQACLLIWGAFEIYCKEVFILSLNERPQLFQNIQKDPELKDYFSVSQGAWPSLLDSCGYDLNGKLGIIVAGNKEFSSPHLLRNLFVKLYVGLPGHPELLKYFQSNDLWQLGQRRNLIAHRCGVVDAEYIKKANDLHQELGSLLQLKGRDVAAGMAIVAQCAIAIYDWARHCWTKPE